MGQSEDTDNQMICLECGGCPTVVGDGGGAASGLYIRRVRRRATWVWLMLVTLLGVLGLPWVQVAIGNWGFRHQLNVGNMFAVRDDRGDFYVGKMSYVALVEPPIRWRDLELVSQGHAEAIEHFRQAVQQSIEYPSRFEKVYSSYEFAVSTPRSYYAPESGRYLGIEIDNIYQYTLFNKDYASVGWPDSWIGYLTTHWYRPDLERFSQEGLRSVEDDLIHVFTVDRKKRWRSILFIAGLVASSGYIVGRVCFWKRDSRRRAFFVGLAVMVVFSAGVFLVGMSQRAVPGHGVVGYMNSLVSGSNQSLDIEELEASLSTDEQVRDLAQTLLEDFGEMTNPNEFVVLGIGSSVGVGSYSLSFGYGMFGEFRLLDVAKYESARVESDGSYTKLPVLEDELGWRFLRRNGYFAFGWGGGKPAMVVYGGLVNYQNVFFLGVGLYVLLRVVCVVGYWFSKCVQRRRIRRGVCVWCRYPCGE